MASQRTLDALALAAVRLLTSAVVWWSGFRAISDDDYARVVIAQRFAGAPAWDPSGTSWLPFPFWVQGSAMLLFGPELHTATAVAWASGVVSTLLIWLGARTLGLARSPAFVAAALASAIAYSAWLGVATVPELLTTGLVVFGAATLAKSPRERTSPGEHNWARERNWGALALFCATLSRYETWPVACVFTLFCLQDAVRQRKLEPAHSAGARQRYLRGRCFTGEFGHAALAGTRLGQPRRRHVFHRTGSELSDGARRSRLPRLGCLISSPVAHRYARASAHGRGNPRRRTRAAASHRTGAFRNRQGHRRRYASSDSLPSRGHSLRAAAWSSS